MTEEFEYSVIGAICMDSRIIDRIEPILSPDDFTIPLCADIYEAACDAISRGQAVRCSLCRRHCRKARRGPRDVHQRVYVRLPNTC